MSTDQLFLDQPYEDTGVRLVAIPTTAGTGSESTRYAVIYYEGKKQSVTHTSIIPDVAILEPSVLKTLPLYQKKCTMLDALCQGIESWWSVNSTDVSKPISKKAVELIMANWRAYIFDNNEEAAAQIMTAANQAGQAICITQTTAAHAFSYKVTSLYGLPHGHAVAVCLHHIWEYMNVHPEKCIDNSGEEYLKSTFLDIAHALGCDTVSEAISLFRSMLDEMEISQPISREREKELEILSSSVNPIRLKNNPVELDGETVNIICNILLGQK
jgi:alcohol dehydrogenase class IV